MKFLACVYWALLMIFLALKIVGLLNAGWFFILTAPLVIVLTMVALAILALVLRA